MNKDLCKCTKGICEVIHKNVRACGATDEQYKNRKEITVPKMRKK